MDRKVMFKKIKHANIFDGVCCGRTFKSLVKLGVSAMNDTAQRTYMCPTHLLHSFRSIVWKYWLALVPVERSPLLGPEAAGGATLDVAVPQLEVSQQRPPVRRAVLAEVALVGGVGGADVAQDHLLAGGADATEDAHPGAIVQDTHLKRVVSIWTLGTIFYLIFHI